MPDPIVTEGHPMLRQKAVDVPTALFGTPELADILERMSASLRMTHNGVAIAAPQIGLAYRIFVVAGFVIAGHERNPEDPDLVCINPKLAKKSRTKESMEEGCLSVPGIYGLVVRSVKATITAKDALGKKFERGGTGLLAQIFQHECDHLEGILFKDTATDLHAEVPRDRTRDQKPNEKDA